MPLICDFDACYNPSIGNIAFPGTKTTPVCGPVAEGAQTKETTMSRNNKKVNNGGRPTAGALFAGMGGFCRGFQEAGINTLWANENNEHASRTFRANYPDVKMLEKDVCDLSVSDDKLAPVDILTAGFPCQSFSHAGHKRGFGDDRGKMFFEIIRLIEEFGENKPKILVLENVPYLANGDYGKWLKTITSKIQLAGYWFDRNNCRMLRTDEISGLPQGRERLFMVAASADAFYCNDFTFPEPESGAKLRPLLKFINRNKKSSARDYLSPDNRYYKAIDEKIEQGDAKSIYQLRRYYVREYPTKCPTLTANMGGGGHNVPFIKDRWGIRRLSVEECAGLQGFENFDFPTEVSTSERYRQIGNAVSVPVAEKLARSCLQLYNSRYFSQRRKVA